MPRAGCIRMILLALALAGAATAGVSRSNQPVMINPFLSDRSKGTTALNPAEVQASYSQSLANTHLAVLGSQLTRELIINNYIRFMNVTRASASPDTLQANFTSFGYFNAPSQTVRQEYCRSAGHYAGAVLVSATNDSTTLNCTPGASSLRIPLGYSLRGFVVPASNRFAQVIDLTRLARASQKPAAVLWSDLDPSWPKRQIRWIFSAQADFNRDLRLIGVRPPSRYQLAATYASAYQNLANHPDSLLLAPTNPSLSAALHGAVFRILSVRAGPGSPAVSATAANLAAYPPPLARGLYFHLNTRLSHSCVMTAFADFMLNYNGVLMNENNAIPLPPAERQAASLIVRRQMASQPIRTDSPTFCRAYAEYSRAHQAAPQPLIKR
jgi:hypothetical protein